MTKGCTQSGPRKGGYWNNNVYFTKRAVHREGRRGGVKRIRGLIYEESRYAKVAFYANYIYDATMQSVIKKVNPEYTRCVTKQTIRRLARRGGVKRFSDLIYKEVRRVVKTYISRIIFEIINFNTSIVLITTEDVLHAIYRMGCTTSGFGIQSPDPYTSSYIYYRDN